MNTTFNKYKWINLIAFSLLYVMVYMGRFNINDQMRNLAVELSLTGIQQELIHVSVFAGYAAGSMVFGYMADRKGPKNVILIGSTLSIMINFSVAFLVNWKIILCLWFLNGCVQSMVWVGGISLLANWFHDRERGKGIGIANFFSGFSHAMAYLIPLTLFLLWPEMEWRLNLIIPTTLMGVFVYIFGMTAVDKPKDKELEPYCMHSKKQASRELRLEEMAAKGQLPWKYFFKRKRFLVWCGIAMFSSICRYGLLNWIPLYYRTDEGGKILSESFSNLILPIGMAFGTLLITWVTGNKFSKTKGIVVTAMAALCGTLVVIFPMIDDAQTVSVAIFFTGFALYGINGILWIYAIDEGCRTFAGTAAGILNGFAYLGACLEGFLFPAVLKLVPNIMTVFVVMELFCIVIVICGMMVSRKDTVIVPEVRE